MTNNLGLRTEIIPAIIPSSLSELTSQVSLVKGLVDIVQVDISDGIFTPTLTWPINSVGKKEFATIVAEKDSLPFWQDVNYEVDLLVSEPEKHINDWIKAGVTSAVIHVESRGDLQKVCQVLEQNFVQVVLGINPSTQNSELRTLITDQRSIQCMGNDKIGFHGVELNPIVLDKISELKKIYPNTPIAIDIGVNHSTIKSLSDVGVTRFVAGSAVFKNGIVEEAIEELKQALDV